MQFLGSCIYALCDIPMAKTEVCDVAMVEMEVL